MWICPNENCIFWTRAVALDRCPLCHTTLEPREAWTVESVSGRRTLSPLRETEPAPETAPTFPVVGLAQVEWGHVPFWTPQWGDWERETERLFHEILHFDQYRAREFLQPGMTVLDVGAHIGLFSFLACSLGASVGAFEPFPPNLGALRRLQEFHDLDLTIFPQAAWHRTGTAWFEPHPASGSSGQVDEAGTIPIRTQRIDDLELDRLDFLKVDAEGSEEFALAGATETLQQCRPLMALSAYHFAGDGVRLVGLLRALVPAYRKARVQVSPPGWPERIVWVFPEGR